MYCMPYSEPKNNNIIKPHGLILIFIYYETTNIN